MMPGTKPRLLDLFSGAGGCAVGYHRAGFDVVGVDLAPQPRYPFAFHRADALEFLAEHGHEFDAIHASPPCQQYTSLRSLHGKEYPDLVAPIRELLIDSGKPWVIENVVGSPLGFGFFLCGTMFPGLRVYRHRRFESSEWLWQPDHPPHRIRAGAIGTKGGRGRKAHYEAGGFVTIVGNVGSYCGEAMGIDWMTGRELSQAIPPAYTEHIGNQLMRVITCPIIPV
jgi:DNA (cytosine-5)-methyltransferase 1